MSKSNSKSAPKKPAPTPSGKKVAVGNMPRPLISKPKRPA